MPNGPTENLTFKLSADTTDLKGLISGLDRLIAQEGELKASFAATNSQYQKQMTMLQALEKQEAELIALKAKESNPAQVAAYNKSLEQTSKKLADLRGQYSAEISIIDNLKAKQGQLKTAMDAAADPATIKRLRSEIDTTTASVRKLEAGTQNVSAGMISLSTAVKTAGAVIAAEFAVSRVRQFGEAIIDTTAEMQGLRKAIDFISKGQGEVAFADLERQAETMGLSLKALSKGFVTFSASVGDKMPLQEQLRLFEQINMGLSVMQVSEQNAERAYLALSQMMSKGTVNAEELKGQLGDALPGALGLAAEAMGVTEKALLKMMEKGELLASDLLPRLGNLMERRFSGGVEAASEGLQASINRENTAWLQLRETLGNVVEPAYKSLKATTVEWLNIFVRSIAGQQLSAQETSRLSSALDKLRTVVALCAGLYLTMTTAGRALLVNFTGLAKGAVNFASALFSMATQSKVSYAGLRSLAVATQAWNATLTVLRGVLAGIGIGLAITAVMKLYEAFTKVDAGTERLNDNMKRFTEAMNEGNASVEAEVTKLQKLFAVLKDVNSSQADRAKAMNTINSQYAQYLPSLLTEQTSLLGIAEAEKAAIAEMEKRLKLMVAQKIYAEQLEKEKSATLALKVAADEYRKVLSETSDLRKALDFTPILNTWSLLFGKVGQDELDLMKRANADIVSARKFAKDLEAEFGVINLLSREASGSGGASANGPDTDKADKSLEEKMEALRRKLREIQREMSEDAIQNDFERRKARLQDMAYEETITIAHYAKLISEDTKYSHAKRAAFLKLSNEVIEQIKIQLEAETAKVNAEQKLAEAEMKVQADIAAVRQQFIDRQILTEEQLNEQIQTITYLGLQKRLSILKEQGKETLAVEAAIQAIRLKQTQDAIEKAKRLEQEAFDARQRFLQQGDADMQRQAIEREFKRKAEQLRAQNQRDGVNIDPSTGQARLTKEQNIVLKRDELEAKRQLEQQYNQQLANSGLRWGKQIQLLGMTLREKELADIKKYYDERIALAEKSGESIVVIEAEKAAAIRALQVQRIQSALTALQQESQYLESAAQNASQIVTNQTQGQINDLEKRYDASINLARIQAEHDARYYGEGSKQAKKSANDLAHIEAEKQYRIQKAQEQGAKNQEKIAVFNKALQVANATIATAQAIIGYLAMQPITPLNIGLSVAAGIAGALQVAAIVAAPIPKYAKGTPRVTGGQPGQDSVHALLMPDERVVPADQNNAYWPTFEAIRLGQVSPSAMNHFAEFGEMAGGPSVKARASAPVMAPVFNDNRIVDAINNKEFVNIDIKADLHGFSVGLERQNSRNRYLDKRFSYKG